MIDHYQRVIALRKQGRGFRAISDDLGIPIARVQNYINGKSKSTGTQKRHASFEIDPARVSALADDHPAVQECRTIFESRVFSPRDVPRLLISGVNSRKTGSKVMKGDWIGMPIYTLTLQERATCPPTCFMFASCYGNSMPWARRIEQGHSFEARLIDEIEVLAHKHPKGFVVRLHILGDFYSKFYVTVWTELLARVPMLHVFGYTARSFKHDRELATAIAAMNDGFPDRCFIRFSGQLPRPGGATVINYKPETTRVPEGLVCPAELSKSECCASCGLCWAKATRTETIVFIKHGNSWARRKPAFAAPVTEDA